MNQIKFLKGKRSSLNNQPLAPGAVYFTEDEHRLYIDTETARIPIVGNSICGKIFWVKLDGGNNAWTNNLQTVDSYYEFMNDSNKKFLSHLLSEDSIIFIGKIVTGTEDNTYPAIIATKSNGTSITFQICTSSYPTDPVWVQVYCPNPKVESYESLDVIKSVFTTRVRLDAEQWERSEDTELWIQKFSFTNINFSEMPYLVNLSDSCIENETDFSLLTINETRDEQGNSYLIFEAPADKKPMFNIEADICIVLARGRSKTYPDFPENEWLRLKISKHTLINHKVVFSVPFSDVEQNEDRFFLAYCPTKSEDYSNIKSIDYDASTQQIVFIFKENVTEVKEEFDCVVIQLNNIATLHNATLKGGLVQTNPIGDDSEGWQEYTPQIQENPVLGRKSKYYSQIWPAAKDKTHILKNVHFPLIFPTSKQNTFDFSKLIETKVYNHCGRKQLQFISKELIKKDLSIIIADFV